ncbi:MAG: hypothetical protein QNK85_03435 [Crocinitomicaceae bacterium]
MKKFSLLILLFIIISSCSKDERQKFKFQGESLRMALDNEPSTYIPRAVMGYYSATVLNQIAEEYEAQYKTN